MVDLNLLLVFSFVIFTLLFFCFFVVMIPVVYQLVKALSSLQRLMDTVSDFEPEVKEVKESIRNVKNLFSKSSSSIRTNLNEASIMTVSVAHGVLTGVKEYFSSCKTVENSYNGKKDSG